MGMFSSEALNVGMIVSYRGSRRDMDGQDRSTGTDAGTYSVSQPIEPRAGNRARRACRLDPAESDAPMKSQPRI